MLTLPPDIEILTTEDASPTLAFRRADGYSERMHHAGGALSESLYIYGDALARAMSRTGLPVRVLSFGLGLGYNELISIAMLRKARACDWKIYSFEAVPFLRESFRLWAEADRHSTTVLSEVLTQVASQIERRLDLDADASAGTEDRPGANDRDGDGATLRAWTREALDRRQLELRGAFPQDVANVNSCNLVYYDAYSNKMDPALWTEEQFERDLNNVLSRDCILATYAATGSLNRALKHLGFRLEPKPGFKGKRESTLAIREHLR